MSTQDQEEILSKVREVVARYGGIERAIDTLDDHASLGDAGMTSHATVNVMLALEAEFGEIPDHLLSRRVFQSLASIAEVMRALPTR